MVCPYCSTDMEPIELGGKTFCSNCGLTVGAVTPKSPIAEISQNNAQPRLVQDVSATVKPPMNPSTPIKDEMKSDLGLPINEAGDLIIASPPNETESLAEQADEPNQHKAPVRLSISSSENEVLPEDGFFTPTTLPASDPVESPIEDDFVAPNNDTSMLADNEIPPLVQSLNIPDEADFDHTPETEMSTSTTPENTKSLGEKITEVDTLGASGILLDILNENYQADSRHEQVEVLEAAETLLDDIRDPDPILADSRPDKLDYGILEDLPQNPVEYPEIKSPLSELEIEAPEESAKIDTEYIESPSTEDESRNDLLKVDHDAFLYKLPHELTEMPNPHTAKETKKEIEEVEAEIETIIEPGVTQEDISSHNYDPDTIPSEDIAGRVEVEVAKPDAVTVPTPPVNTAKQDLVTSFFKEKVEGPQKKSFWSKKKTKVKKTKKPKVSAKSKGKPFKLWLILILVVPIALLLLLSGFFAYYYFAKPAEQSARATESAQMTDFSSLTPAAVPTGFEMTSSNFDPAKKELNIGYAFVTDKSKTLTYKQKETAASETDLKSFVDSRSGAAYTSKEELGITFTEFSDGTLAWTNDRFLFTIEAVGFDYSHDLLYKMAESLG